VLCDRWTDGIVTLSGAKSLSGVTGEIPSFHSGQALHFTQGRPFTAFRAGSSLSLSMTSRSIG
jgi:hypothetical protein